MKIGVNFFLEFLKFFKKKLTPKFKACPLVEVLMSEFDAELVTASEGLLEKNQKLTGLLAKELQLKKKIKDKELELAKAREQLEYSERKATLRDTYMAQRSALLKTADMKVTQIENRGERRVDKVKEMISELETKLIDTENKFDDRIRALEKQKDDTLAKIKKQIRQLESTISEKEERTEERKMQETQSFKDRIAFYDRELARLESEASTPRIKGLEFELRTLNEELWKVEEDHYGESPTKRLTYNVSIRPATPPTPKTPELEPVKPKIDKLPKASFLDSDSDSDSSFEPPKQSKKKTLEFLPSQGQQQARPMYPKIIQSTKVGKR